jgi:hypothetical protein
MIKDLVLKSHHPRSENRLCRPPSRAARRIKTLSISRTIIFATRGGTASLSLVAMKIDAKVQKLDAKIQ